ncbi:T9SS type A sorting domain-containing protein [Carboxylicivirga sp. N1Y90]|uniref:T9SS type A sorting domain-containing protein n=1 Tax=Carboxylicivirga fragile TaxID=3417571 RepID=UPI003D345FD2|nr:T9SS type A sorting domain-containing protein [Marinilabiliaceae bacterium N1Y90]
MKKFLLGLMVLLTANAFAQSTHTIDFEPTGVGADWTWIMDQNDDNPPMEFIANPVSGGVNTSATVAKFIARQTGAAWALCITTGDGEFTFDNTNSTVKMMVYKTVVSDVGFKVEGADPATEIKVANTLINEWEELTFDFSGVEGQSYNKLVIIPDFTARAQENIVYFDNIQVPDGVDAAPENEPTSAASAPSHLQANVYSLFSDTYTANAPASWTQGWGSGSVEDFDISGNATKKYTALNFQAITLASTIDLSAYTHMHIDTWMPVSGEFGVKFQDFGADDLDEYPNVDDSEFEVKTGSKQTAETWVGHDFAISDFTGLTGTANLGQIQVLLGSIDGTAEGTVYIDNLYFYNGTPTAIGDAKIEKLSIYPNPVTDVLNIQGQDEGTVVEIYGATGNLVKKVQVSAGSVNVAELAQGVYFVSVNGATSKIIKK